MRESITTLAGLVGIQLCLSLPPAKADRPFAPQDGLVCGYGKPERDETCLNSCSDASFVSKLEFADEKPSGQ
jgi:hypothetical protein